MPTKWDEYMTYQWWLSSKDFNTLKEAVFANLTKPKAKTKKPDFDPTKLLWE